MKRNDKLVELLERIRSVELATHRRVQDLLAGQYRSVFRGRGVELDQIREYVPGDDVRAIDWNVTARMGRPFVKEHIEERQLTLLLLVDVSASAEFGSSARDKRDRIAELASALAFSAIETGDRVGLVLFTDRIERFVPPGKGRRHVLRILREILTVEPEGTGTDLVEPLELVRRVQRKRAVVVMVSDFLESGDREVSLTRLQHAMRLTNARHDVIAARVRDPREVELPDVGWLVLEDAETGEEVEIDTSRREVRERYAADVRRQSEELAAALRAARVDALEVFTDEEVGPALLSFFRRRGRGLS
ncbi:MAG: DUF58 domain-containing protein [Sandaracinaceae bacterium]